MPFFGRRKRQPEPATLLTARAAAFSDILVTTEALDQADAEPAALALDVVNYINARIKELRFYIFENPPKALGIYFYDLYLSQVKNGGHSQYLANATPNKFVADTVEQVLTEMDAPEFLALFRDLRTWMSENPHLALRQTGFSGGIAPFMKDLDNRFFALDHAAFDRARARWIAALPELRTIPKADWAAEWERLAALAQGTEPPSDALIQAHQDFSNRTRPDAVCLGVVCQYADPPRRLTAVVGQTPLGGSDPTAKGLFVKTDRGDAFAAIVDHGVYLYSFPEQERLTDVPTEMFADTATRAMADAPTSLADVLGSPRDADRLQ